jgi:hypothetical protein
MIVVIADAADHAQSSPNWIPCHTQACAMESGRHDGAANETTLVFGDIVRIPGAPWIRLHFSDCHLGRQSYLVLTSLLDGGRQTLDAEGLARSGNWSAYFNGEAVRVELHAAPDDQGIFVRTQEITVGEWRGGDAAPSFSAAASCPDRRVSSADPRVGRLIHPVGGGFTICTAWLVSNGSLVTAGHCADGDPDQLGPMLPDGVLDFNTATLVEFNRVDQE